MKWLSTIWNFIKNLFKDFSFKDWIIFILVVLVLIFGFTSRHYYNKSLYPELVYPTDSIEVYKNKLNEEYLARNMYVQTIDQLKKENSELYTEVKNLKDNPIIITKTKVETKIDTVITVSDSIISPTLENKRLFWHINEPNSYYSIAGHTDVQNDFSNFSTVLTNVRVPVTLTVDLVEDAKKSQLRLITKSDNPYVTVTNMDGVVIDPTKSSVMKSYFKPKRWSVGPQFGIGVNDKLQPGFYLGVGISYSIWQF